MLSLVYFFCSVIERETPFWGGRKDAGSLCCYVWKRHSWKLLKDIQPAENHAQLINTPPQLSLRQWLWHRAVERMQSHVDWARACQPVGRIYRLVSHPIPLYTAFKHGFFHWNNMGDGELSKCLFCIESRSTSLSICLGEALSTLHAFSLFLDVLGNMTTPSKSSQRKHVLWCIILPCIMKVEQYRQ